jgi:hypothetical protein
MANARAPLYTAITGEGPTPSPEIMLPAAFFAETPFIDGSFGSVAMVGAVATTSFLLTVPAVAVRSGVVGGRTNSAADATPATASEIPIVKEEDFMRRD